MPRRRARRKSPRICLIGVGNPDRGDDGIGLEFVRRARSSRIRGVTVLESNGDPTRLMEMWKGFERVIIVDAISSGAAPGTLHRIDAQEGRIPSRFHTTSTHGFSVFEAIELGRTLRRLPPSLIVFGIEASAFAIGTGPSEPVRRSLPPLWDMIQREIEAEDPTT